MQCSKLYSAASASVARIIRVSLRNKSATTSALSPDCDLCKFSFHAHKFSGKLYTSCVGQGKLMSVILEICERNFSTLRLTGRAVARLGRLVVSVKATVTMWLRRTIVSFILS